MTDPGAVTRYIVRVRFRDTDLMGIVHHASYLEYLEAGRIEYLRRRGMDYGDWTRRGVHLAVAEVQLSYRKSARFDDRIVVETRLAELGRASVRFVYRITREGTEELITEGETLLACVGDNGGILRLPAELASVLQGPETLERELDRV